MPFNSGIEKYINDPTSTTLETTDYPIWNIDFPGVTICPNAKVPTSKHENEQVHLFSLQISTSRFRAALKNKDMPWKKILEDDSSLQGYLQVFSLYHKNLFCVFGS